jgi:FkbM family methyltransferase
VSVHDPVVAELRLPGALARMRTAWAGREMARVAQQHLQAGLPQMAVFAFDHVGRNIALWGRYEREELDLLMQAVKSQLRPGGLCLDIGANVGNHALFFAEHFAEVWAFEPNPRTFALLSLNASLRSNVRTFAFGLSDADATAQLQVPAHNLGMASLHSRTPSSSDSTVACELRRLDSWAEVQGRRVSLMKIDVEGHELAVLRGARELLARDRPVVVFEQAANEIHQGRSATMDLLRDAGYTRWWTTQPLPQPGRFRPLNLLRRVLQGDGWQMLECSRLAPRFHSMVVALPAPQ